MTKQSMTSRERMLTALGRGVPDRVPATVHQWQAYHLKHFLGGRSDLEAFRYFGLDAAISVFDANQGLTTPEWQVESRRYSLEDGNPSSTGGKHKVRSLCRMTSATTIPSPLSYASGMMHPRAMGR